MGAAAPCAARRDPTSISDFWLTQTRGADVWAVREPNHLHMLLMATSLRSGVGCATFSSSRRRARSSRRPWSPWGRGEAFRCWRRQSGGSQGAVVVGAASRRRRGPLTWCLLAFQSGHAPDVAIAVCVAGVLVTGRVDDPQPILARFRKLTLGAAAAAICATRTLWSGLARDGVGRAPRARHLVHQTTTPHTEQPRAHPSLHALSEAGCSRHP